MYRSVGADPLIFNPGSVTTRRAPPDVSLPYIPPAPVRKPPDLSLLNKPPAATSVPALLPTATPSGGASSDTNMTAIYIAAGGVVVLGALYFVMRK